MTLENECHLNRLYVVTEVCTYNSDFDIVWKGYASNFAAMITMRLRHKWKVHIDTVVENINLQITWYCPIWGLLILKIVISGIVFAKINARK